MVLGIGHVYESKIKDDKLRLKVYVEETKAQEILNKVKDSVSIRINKEDYEEEPPSS